MSETIHNPDQYMGDLRQILAQGRKRLALFAGAGTPAGILVNEQNTIATDGSSLIPITSVLTPKVLENLKAKHGEVLRHY